MRKASAPTLFVVGLLVVAAVGGITFGVASVAGVGDDDVAAPVATTPTSDPDLTAAQVTVTGTATSINIQGAVLPADVIVPAVVTPSAGLGAGARFEGVLVDGEPASVSWDAGRPLALGADTPLRLRAGTPLGILATPAGVVVAFVDGVAYAVVPGDYRIEAPVAVTTTGLGSSVEALTFTAGDASTVAFTGGANGTMPASELSATGPGSVSLQGTFEVHHPDGTVQGATDVALPAGSFRLAAAPTADGTGFTLTDALLEGLIIVS